MVEKKKQDLKKNYDKAIFQLESFQLMNRVVVVHSYPNNVS